MVIVRLIGGMGNQMFQYAAGRRLAHVTNSILKLDFRPGGPLDTPRSYNLFPFNIEADPATPEEMAGFLGEGRARRRFFLGRLLRRRQPLGWPGRHVVESGFRFNPAILDLDGDVYLYGYWQSEKYFKDIGDIIRSEFTVKTGLEGQNGEMARFIRSVAGSVSVHVRRGDYISNPETYKYHGICSPEYYLSAAHKVARLSSKPHFFVFSDDIPWCRTNLRLPYPTTFVDFNDDKRNYEDLRLMGLCRHHIIANSSFSWWGAWLCENPERTVIAPARWFSDPSIDISDLIPESWTCLNLP